MRIGAFGTAMEHEVSRKFHRLREAPRREACIAGGHDTKQVSPRGSTRLCEIALIWPTPGRFQPKFGRGRSNSVEFGPNLPKSWAGPTNAR